jgi:enoyl-CoA hydratase/carnithine racemase
MSFECVLYDVQDGVCTVTLNRPEKMNTWTARLAMDLSAALRKANDDDHVRAVVITGAGRAFCAGADLERGSDTFAGRDTSDRPQADMPTVYPNQIDKPVIAAINGAAVGVGMTYPMLCDIRLAADTAKMGFVFTRRGMMPELAAHLIVQRVIGFSNAADLLMSGRIFTAQEAGSMGLVSRVLPKEDLLPAATAMAREYVNAAPASVALTKRLLWKGLHSSPEQMMQAEHRPFAWLGNQADAREGIMSFLEKRAPVWTGSPRDIPDAFR